HQTNNYLFFYSQLRPSITLYTLTAFSLLYQITSRISYNRFIHKLANLSFFVYFIHVAVMEFYWKFGINTLFLQSYSILNDLVFFLLVVITSFIIGYAAHKIPKLSLITG